MDFRGLRASRLLRCEAAKFTIKPAWPAGEVTIHRSTRHEDQLGLFMRYGHGAGGHLIGVWTNNYQWLLNLESRISHLTFCRGRRGQGGGWPSSDIGGHLALTAETAVDTEFQVDHWELVPAMLAADERFEWRV